MDKEFEIFIVEDDEDLGQMIKLMLSTKYKKITHFVNANSLMDELQKKHPDLLIMDMFLSGSDGREICRNLKSAIATSGIKIMLMSAHHEGKNSCLQAGADAFLQKPFEMKLLRLQVQQLLT